MSALLRDRISSLQRGLDRLDNEMRKAIATYEIYRRSAYDRSLIAAFNNTLEAHAFNVIRDHLHYSALLALMRMWDEDKSTKVAIPQLMRRLDVSIIDSFVTRRREAMLDITKRHLVNDGDIDDEVTRQALRESLKRMAQRDAEHAGKALRQQIGVCRRLANDRRFREMRAVANRYRNKVLAHIGNYPGRQSRTQLVRPLRYGDTEIILERTIRVLELLNSIVRDLGMNYGSTQKVWRRYSGEFWNRIKQGGQKTSKMMPQRRAARSGEG